MKNKFLSLFMAVILLLLSLLSLLKLYGVDTERKDNEIPKKAQKGTQSDSEEKVRAVWIFYKELATDNPDKKAYEKKISEIFRTLEEEKYNVAFVQVRAFSDAFYRSEFFKSTKYLCGGDMPFDALEIICKYAKKHGVHVHAWINPYRVSYDKTEKVTESMLKTDSGIYYDPSSANVQRLIINGIREIIDNYEVYGIHLDDYFYPTDIGDADKDSYIEYKKNGGTLETDAWRRSNVNNLIKEIYRTLKEKDENLIFSVSPGHLQHMFCNVVFSGTVRLYDCRHHVLWHIFIISQKLFCIFRQTVPTVPEGWVIIMTTNTRIQTYAIDNLLCIQPFHLSISVQLIEV